MSVPPHQRRQRIGTCGYEAFKDSEWLRFAKEALNVTLERELNATLDGIAGTKRQGLAFAAL